MACHLFCAKPLTKEDDLAIAWNSVDIREITQYLQLNTKDWVQLLFQIIINEQACMFRSS